MKEKILITSVSYFPNVGGVENSLHNLAKGYSKSGYYVDVVASDISGYHGKIKKIERINAKSICVRYSSSFLWLKKNKLASYLCALFMYRKLNKRNSYKYAICRNHITVLLCKAAGIKSIYYVLPGVYKNQGKVEKASFGEKSYSSVLKSLSVYYFHSFLQYAAVRVADRNYVFSKTMMDQVRSELNYKERMLVTAPGIDCCRFSIPSGVEKKRIRDQLGLNRDSFIILGLGRLVRVKGYDFLLESMLYLPNNFKVILVGEGSQEENLKILIDDLRIKGRVKFFPATSSPELYFKAADIFILTSIYEPFGQTLLEAQSSGLPVVAFSSDLPEVTTATNDIISIENSVLVNEFSPRSLADGILLAFESLQGGVFSKVEIRNHVINKFSWDNMIEDLESP